MRGEEGIKMKNNYKFYVIGWTVLYIAFNFVVFLFGGGVENGMKYSPSFWIGYSFISLSFIANLMVSYFVFKDGSNVKTLYNLPAIKASFIELIISFVVGGLFMVIPVLPYWVGIIICWIIFALRIIPFLKARYAAEAVEDIDKKIEKQTDFMKGLIIEAERLISAASEEMVKDCEKVYETLRYSDPVSSPAVKEAEKDLERKFEKFSEAVSAKDVEKASVLGKETIAIAERRNAECKKGK